MFYFQQSTRVFSPHLQRVPFVITVRLGSAMVRNAWVYMDVCAPCKMLFVLNAIEMCGVTVEGSFSAHSAPITSVKMISLSIKLLAKFWKPKRTSVSRVIDTASTLASSVRSATARITSGVKASSTNVASRCPVRNAASRQTRPKIWACQVI